MLSDNRVALTPASAAVPPPGGTALAGPKGTKLRDSHRRPAVLARSKSIVAPGCSQTHIEAHENTHEFPPAAPALDERALH